MAHALAEFALHDVPAKDLRAGDHVYVWRAAYTYQHHGIALTDGPDAEIADFSPPGKGCSCTSVVGTVRAVSLEEFAAGQPLKRVRYGVGFAERALKRAGTCTG